MNPRAGSITVHYEPERLNQTQILERLEQVGCLGTSIRIDQGATRVHEVVGKALVGAVMQKLIDSNDIVIEKKPVAQDPGTWRFLTF